MNNGNGEAKNRNGDDDDDSDDASNKGPPQSDNSGGGSTTNIEKKKAKIKTTLEVFSAKVPVVLMQREDADKAEKEAKALVANAEGNAMDRLGDSFDVAVSRAADNSNKIDADVTTATTTTTTTTAAAVAITNDENENSSNNTNNSDEEDAATKHQEEDVVIRAIREGVWMIRIPLARQNSANLWQHCV